MPWVAGHSADERAVSVWTEKTLEMARQKETSDLNIFKWILKQGLTLMCVHLKQVLKAWVKIVKFQIFSTAFQAQFFLWL